MVLVQEKKVPKKVTPVEKCICEICTCGHHRCPHTINVTDHIASELKSPITGGSIKDISTESREQFKTFNQIERQKLARPKTSLRLGGPENVDRDEFQSKELERRKKYSNNQNEVAAGIRSKNQISAAEIMHYQSSDSQTQMSEQQNGKSKKFRQKQHRQADNGIFTQVGSSHFSENLASVHNSSISMGDKSRLAGFEQQGKGGLDNVMMGGGGDFHVSGSQNETMSSATIHDFGEVQGMTVVSQSRRSEGQAADSQFAEGITRFEGNFDGIDIEDSLSNAKVRSVHEKEISQGTVKISHSGLETSENTIKSITELKSAKVKVENSPNMVEVDERVVSSTISTDKQTFQFDELPTTDAERTVRKQLNEHDIMNLETTNLIDYTDNYKDDLQSKRDVRVGQVLVEEVFDIDLAYDARDGESNMTNHTRHSENLKTTTVLEKSKDPNREAKSVSRAPIKHLENLQLKDGAYIANGSGYQSRRPRDNLQMTGVFYGKGEESMPLTVERSKMARPKDNLHLEGKFYNEPEVTDQTLQKRGKAAMIRPRDSFKFEDSLSRRGSQSQTNKRNKRHSKATGKIIEDDSAHAQNIERDSIQIDTSGLDLNNEFGGEILGSSWPDKVLDGIHAEEGFSLKYEEGNTEQMQENDTEIARRELTDYQIDDFKNQNEVNEHGSHGLATVGGPSENILYSSKMENKKNTLELDSNNTGLRVSNVQDSRYIEKPNEIKFLKGDRYAMKLPKDNLHGYSMSSAEIEEFHTGKRYYVQRPFGNLEVPEIRLRDDVPESEQNKQIKNKRAIAFPSSPEKTRPILPEDNLRLPEGSFTQRPKEQFTLKGDRYEVKKPKDNLKSEGEFYVNPQEELVQLTAKRVPIKQQDNLKLEGKFSQRFVEDASLGGERAEIRMPFDNLKMEGNFYKAEETEAPIRGERAETKRPKDNLRMEGEFYKKPPVAEVLTGERYERKLPKDNLLLSEGKFYTRPKEDEYQPAKRHPILQNDNLKMTGEFYVHPSEAAPLKGERADVWKPEDNLRSEGEFYGNQLSYTHPRPFDNANSVDMFYKNLDEVIANQPERRTAIRQLDNLHLEGDFYRPPPRQKMQKGERADMKIPANNLRLPEGQFTQRRVENAVIRGERADVKRPEDNLKLEGKFYKKQQQDVPDTLEKRQMIKQQDNLHPEGKFYQRPTEDNHLFDEQLYRRNEDLKSGYMGGRRTPILQKDNLYPEGEFYGQSSDLLSLRGDHSKNESSHQLKGEKAEVKRPSDNLKPEGQFYRKPKPSKAQIIELRSPIRQKDNLFLEGEFHRPPVKEACLKGERAPVKRPISNLKMEGKFYEKPKEEYLVPGEKSVVRVPKDNLKPEGKFYIPDEDLSQFRFKRPELIVQKDNLHMEGKFYGQTTMSEHFNKYDLSGPHELTEDDLSKDSDKKESQGVRASMSIPKDSLYLEGQMYLKHHEKPVLIGERAEIKIHEDNLHSSGEFYGRSRAEAPLKGDRAEVKIPQDNLRLSSGTMDLLTTTQFQQKSVLNTQNNVVQLNPLPQEPPIQETTRKDENELIQSNEANLKAYKDTGSMDLNRRIKGRRTTVENFNEDNNTGHIFLEKSIESSMEHGTKSDISKDKAQKILTQSMSAKSVMNQSILLNDANNTERSQNLNTQKQIHGNKNSTHEVQVTREVGITKRENEFDGITHSSFGFESNQNGVNFNNDNFNKDTVVINNNSGESRFETKSGMHRPQNLLIANDTERRSVETKELNSQSRIIPIQQKNSAKVKSSSSQVFSNNQHNKNFELQNVPDKRLQLESKKHHMRQDNLIIPKSEFHGQTSSRSYGDFQSSNSQRVIPVRSNHDSTISLGTYDNFNALMNSTSRTDFKKQEVHLCPASLLESSKSPFKYKRQTSNHRFYMPSVVS